MSDLINYKCKACGGNLKFNSKKQKIICTYCAKEYEAHEFESLPKSDEKNNLVEKKIDWNLKAQGLIVYICKTCGGQVVGDESLATTKCPFCKCSMIISQNISGYLEPDIIIPFKQNKTTAMEMFSKHMNSYKYVPDEFKDENHIEEIIGVYVPFWVYDADVHASIRCVKRLNKFLHGRSSDAVYEGDISFRNVPADASQRFDNKLMDSIEPYDFNEALPYSAGYMAGYLAEKMDVDEFLCHLRTDERIRNSCSRIMRNKVSGFNELRKKVFDWKKTSYSYKYALLPVWILNTKWQNKNYIFALNGQTGKMVGDLPVSMKKLKILFWSIFAIIMGAFLAIMLLTMDYDIISILGLIVLFVSLSPFVALHVGFYTYTKYDSTKNVFKSKDANGYILKGSYRKTREYDK